MAPTVLFYAPYAIWRFHFETELELIEKYLQRGYQVTILSCFGDLPSCESNPQHKGYLCQLCRSRQKAGIEWIGPHRIQVENFYWLTPAQQQEVDKLKTRAIPSIEALKQIELEGSDIGLAALSSIVSMLRETQPDIGQHDGLIRHQLMTAAIVHYSVKNHLLAKQPDEFVLCNGRFSAFKPALRIARALGIETYVHERAAVLDRYYLIPNGLPHEIEPMKRQIEQVYEESPLTALEKQEIAYTWYQERLRNHPQSWVSYTEKQKQDLLPETIHQLPAEVIRVAIFNNSDEEFVTFEEWKNPFYPDQNQGIYQILEALRPTPQFHFFLRIHPNLRGLDNSQTRFLAQLGSQFPNLEVIAADSAVSTYALMDACDLVLTFGSTAGIEALYKGKPSILMGRSLYEDLGGFVQPQSHGELITILQNYGRDRSLPAVDNPDLAVIKYGFFQKMYGETFEYAKPYSTFKVGMQRQGKETFLKAALIPKLMLRLGI